MAKFISTSEINETWRGIWEFSGPAGTVFRIPDSLQSQFDAEMSSRIPGLTWTVTDEIAGAGGAHVHPESAITDLTTDLAGKAATGHGHATVSIASDSADITGVNFATQTAALAAPGAGHIVMFATSDGLFAKDAATQVTTINIPVASAFPAAPFGGQFCFRSDRKLLYVYDDVGTRWVTVNLYRDQGSAGGVLPGTTTDNSELANWTPWHTGADLFLQSLYASVYIQTTNSSSSYWTLTLYKDNAANADTQVAQFNTSTYTASTWNTSEQVINALLGYATYKRLWIKATKVGTPGAIFFAFGLSYRLVG